MQYRSMLAVLVVEDDPDVRRTALAIVRSAGYVAIEASDADAAIAILDSGLAIAALFTDIEMPGSIDGLKLAHAVRARWPPIKIVIVSGRAECSMNEMPSDSRFLSKPYRASEVAAELRSLIGGL